MRRSCPFSACSAPLEKRSKMTNGDVTEPTTPGETLFARGYQTELVEQAKIENLIICLPTGSGKTYIAVMLIKELANAVRSSLKNGGKRTIFLVKTVQLVDQQSDYIKTHTDLSVGCYYGELGVDSWGKDEWNIEFEDHQVLVFTAQVFLNIVDHNYFSLNQVNLIIFDECQHATGDNQYAALMNNHYDQCSAKPRVLGLTASISIKKIQAKDLEKISKELEKTYRARIESGSQRAESVQHGTSVQVQILPYSSYRQAIIQSNESLTIPFDFLRAMIDIIEKFISNHNDKRKNLEFTLSETMITTDYKKTNLVKYQKQSSDFTIHTQAPTNVLQHLKRFLENVIEVGYELGLAGLFFFANDLRNRLQKHFLLTNNQEIQEIFDDISQRFHCLVDDILKTLYLQYSDDEDILFSPKVLSLMHQIIQQQEIQNYQSKCIVFVERVYTAATLSRVLSKVIPAFGEPWCSLLKVKHVTGIKAIFGDAPMTAKHQKQTIKEFRTGSVNILVATAVVEEGLDIPTCNLVIRFNKPNNFSSYMQSKGRARSKKNAAYVLFMETNPQTEPRDKKEYQDYDQLEQMIQSGNFRDENNGNIDAAIRSIPPYCPSPGIVIDAPRAAQLIMQYCILLGNGQVFPPRFLFNGPSSPYTCILSMPANCPVRDDILCDGDQKKIAKYKCCLEMVKKLHEQGEFNEHCAPSRRRTIINIEIPIENKIFTLADRLFEKKNDSSFQVFPRQIAIFPIKSDEKSTVWYLYKINSELGFVIQRKLMKLPKFYLYNPIESIQIEFIQTIASHQLDKFCSYLFEHVFDDMNIPNLLQFDMNNSPFQLYPCLITKSNEIDYQRIELICSRRTQIIHNYSQLTETELYTTRTPSGNTFYKYTSSVTRVRGNDEWMHKKTLDSIRTYDDYFTHKYPNISIEKNALFASMNTYRQVNINYLQEYYSQKKKNEHIDEKIYYYPIEYLQYAPLNQYDYELIYKLPSILFRLSQLYRIEKLRKAFAKKMNSYSFIEPDQMPIVTFHDCLKSTTNPPLLPLIPLIYQDSLSNLQPSPDILFQAITRRSTGEATDMENLEILGDCFLKLTVSLYLYHHYPSASAGALTIEKAKQISNGNLYRIAVHKDIESYLNVINLNFRGKQANWIPPGYKLVTDDREIIDRYLTQKVKRKAFADMIEGLIGAYLVTTDYFRTMQFMSWLGLDIIPIERTIPSIVCSSIDENQIECILMNFYREQKFDQIEQTMNYQFKNKAYLIAAFTHPSSFANRLTDCYERLEFLGDAVLDFLVTRYVFVQNDHITPGLVTDIRQDLSNNGRLAYLLVAYRLHQRILHNSPDLFGQISVYVGDEELFPKDSSMENLLNKDIDQWADSTAPKALADVFEALVGAIFLDSNKCLKTVWTIIEPLLRHYLDRSVKNPNLNPVRTFYEQGGKTVVEGTEKDNKTESTRSVCLIEANNGYYIRGYGSNRKAAKFDACRKAVKEFYS